MALTVETGSGLAAADSYVSVADADAYHVAHATPAAWTAAITANKEKALRLAAQFLDVRYGACWRGVRASSSQGLDWPRSSVVDADGYALDSTVIPAALKQAQAEAALRALSASLLADLSNPAPVKSQTIKVGPIEKSTEYAVGNGPVAEYQVIDGLLRKLVTSAGELRRA